MKKPIILVVLHRRYYELCKNLPRYIEQFKKELQQEPVVVVVWSEPNVGHLWIFQELIDQGLITHFLTRIEGGHRKSISYHCARDMRVGLDFIKKEYGENFFAICHCADICPREGVYFGVNCEMQTHEAYLCALPNNIVHNDIWHTNFFAVGMNEEYWPPLIPDKDPDILEHKWGKELKAKCLNNYFHGHNNYHKTFAHDHDSEYQPDFALVPQTHTISFCLHIKGRQNLLTRSFTWLKSLLRLILKKKP